MVCRTLRIALMVGAITAVAVLPARASHRSAPCCDNPCAPAANANACAPTAPAYRTITVTQCVPETYQVRRTAYRMECQTQQYTYCRTECVAECRERMCTVTKRVPVMKTECRKVCRNVTTYEERTVMKTCYQTVQETVMEKRLVRLGHWECRESCGGGLFGGHGGGGGLFGGPGPHNNNCGDPCATNCAPVRTRQVWVHCPEYTCCPRTVCKKVCVQVPSVCRVPVCHQVWEDCTVQVCTYQCVTEQVCQKYTVMVSRQVPCTATRVVRVCVPYQETVTCCRMVARQVCRQVPVTECCNTSSCCETSCCSSGHGGGGLLSGLRNRHCCR